MRTIIAYSLLVLMAGAITVLIAWLRHNTRDRKVERLLKRQREARGRR